MTARPGPADKGRPRRRSARVRGDLPDDGLHRLENLLLTIQEYASMRFDERAEVGADGDIIDAIAGGVNFLGEELEASFDEVERRVADRTAELVLATRELSRRALHDELTGLPNRALLWELLTRRVQLANRRPNDLAVLFLDLDDFKVVNDTFGHGAGDQLLVDVASRLRDALRAGDTAARVGGDEFVVLLDDVATRQAALLVAIRLDEELRKPYEVAGKRMKVNTSIGVAVGRDAPDTADGVVAAADSAMYDAKRRGEGRWVLYDEDIHGSHRH